MNSARLIFLFSLLLLAVPSFSDTLEVGPGKPFSRIEDANQRAVKGDVILVYPLPDAKPYEKVAVYVTTPGLTFRAVPAKPDQRIVLSGKGFDYSGVGRVPRAIFQFNPGANWCRLEGFELTAAHNDSHNGAGVRINQANDVYVLSCLIHHNDMGIMSNGDGSLGSATNQFIERCIIRDNGDVLEPGYNHNLYLGGASVTLRACEVSGSLTGHNVKSRAHFTRIEYCYIHHSSNRELDLVDAPETVFPDSNVLLVGNLIAKDPNCSGNRAVIHFGADGGKEHDGTLFMLNNTVITSCRGPVIDLSAPKARLSLINNIVCDPLGETDNQVLVVVRAGADLKNATGTHNLISGGFPDLPPGFPPAENPLQHRALSFTDIAHQDYHLGKSDPFIVIAGLPFDKLPAPLAAIYRPGPVPGQNESFSILVLVYGQSPLFEYIHPANYGLRVSSGSREPGSKGAPDLGAFAYRPKP